MSCASKKASRGCARFADAPSRKQQVNEVDFGWCGFFRYLDDAREPDWVNRLRLEHRVESRHR